MNTVAGWDAGPITNDLREYSLSILVRLLHDLTGETEGDTRSNAREFIDSLEDEVMEKINDLLPDGWVVGLHPDGDGCIMLMPMEWWEGTTDYIA